MEFIKNFLLTIPNYNLVNL